MTAILGISAFYHDSAAALIVDGDIVAAAQEERFTCKKHDFEFPTEEIMLRAARFAHELTGMRNLCLAGGVALNCVGNGRIFREGPFEHKY